MKKKTIFLLLAILLVGGFFRFWDLKNTPPGLYPDEAMNGMDAVATLQTGQFKIFYPENNGREGLFVWLAALNFGAFGISVWSLRLVSAIIGFLTILGLFLLAKELFDEKIALLSSFFLAISFWHVNFSRIAFRAIFVPFLMCFSFYFLLKGLNNYNKFKKNSSVLLYLILAGIFFGLGFYTYIAFRMAVLLLGFLLLMKMWQYWKENRVWSFKKVYFQDGWWRWDVFFITVLIIALPIGLHFYHNPSDFMGRASGVSIFNSPQPLQALAISSAKTLAMFNFVGDWNWRHNYSGAPMLSWIIGILFLIGLILSIIKIFKKESWNFCEAKRYFPALFAILFILAWFLIMLLPAILTIEGIPHALRTIGVLPVVYIFAALGFVWLAEKVQQRISQTLAIAFLSILLICPACFNFNQYFLRWANEPAVAASFDQNLVDIGNYINNLPKDVSAFLIANGSQWDTPVPYPNGLAIPAQTVMFIEQTKQSQATYFKPSEINLIKINPNQKTAVILLRPDENLMNQLSQRWPNGQIRRDDIWSLIIN